MARWRRGWGVATMLVLDLRTVGFVLLLAFIAAIAGAVWLDRRSRRKAAPPPIAPSVGEVGLQLERAPFGIVLLGDGRGYHYANPYAQRLLGLPSASGELPAAPWTGLLATDRASVRREAMTAGRYRVVALAPNAVDGSTPPDRGNQVVRWWVVALGDRDLVYVLDVTTQQRAEDAARSLINDLSHELRTPLATILTHLEVLSLANISEAIERQSIGLLKAEAQRMARLIHQMLELGRLETSVEIARRPVDFLAIVEESIAQVAHLAESKGIAIALEADANLPLVVGDGDRLRQVLLNLLDNAVKYCRTEDRVIVSLRQTMDGVDCTIRDTGPGISARHLPHLTHRFYRAAAQETAGSGLGLTLVDEILRRHESRLEIESQAEGEQTGTCVGFVLRAVAAAPNLQPEVRG